jgi:voltage-gated potassium channel
LDPSKAHGWSGTLFEAVFIVSWGMFLVDYVVRLLLSRRRGRFVVRNLADLGAVVLPMLRPLRLLRLITLLSILNKHAGGAFRGRVAVYVAGASALVLFVASLAMLDAERNAAGSNITSFGDSVWWALTTVTTVGYGDHYPVTLIGRCVAAALMLAGIALIGVVTGSFATWLVERVAAEEEESRAATRRDVNALAAEVSRLSALIESQNRERP